jgi:hypothetical protein
VLSFSGVAGFFIGRYSLIKILISLDFLAIGLFMVTVGFAIFNVNYNLFLIGIIIIIFSIVETIVLVLVFLYSKSKQYGSKYGTIYSRFGLPVVAVSKDVETRM